MITKEIKDNDIKTIMAVHGYDPIMIQRVIDNCEFTIEFAQCQDSVNGNAIASGDEDYDNQVESDIIDQLNMGNFSHWMDVAVGVRVKSDEYGHTWVESLGQCSYNSFEDFMDVGSYYGDMLYQSILNVLSSDKLNEVVRLDTYPTDFISKDVLNKITERNTDYYLHMDVNGSEIMYVTIKNNRDYLVHYCKQSPMREVHVSGNVHALHKVYSMFWHGVLR